MAQGADSKSFHGAVVRWASVPQQAEVADSWAISW
jgi:hypothetical protein